jgi:transcriptional regulator with XRE-family HTH domain
MTEKTIHEGRNIKRIREILGVKQEALATELGLSQQAVSALEQKEALDRDMLEKVAKALKVSPDAIRNYSEENIVFHIQNMNDNAQAIYHYNFNPLDKLMEVLEENKKLYLALLKEKDEKIALLEKLLDKK